MSDIASRFAHPPRRVPGSLIVANLFNGASQFGWVFFGFGMIFFWVFGMNADFSFLSFREPLLRAAAEVTEVEDTGASVGGSKHQRGTPIYANHYAFSAMGRRIEGVSYSTGRAVNAGDAVTVEFVPDRPEESRIAGMRRKMFGAWAIIVAIFPLVGLIAILFATRAGMRRNHLLRDGMFAMATLIDSRPTNTKINKQTVYELTFRFQSYDGRQHEVKTRTHQPQRLRDESAEPLLYDPQNPTRAYLLDEVPTRPTFNLTGELEGRPGLALALLILPALTIAGHGAWMWLR